MVQRFQVKKFLCSLFVIPTVRLTNQKLSALQINVINPAAGFGSFFVYRMQMKHIVEPLFVSHCILVQYCFLSCVSIILRHLCPVHQVRALGFESWHIFQVILLQSTYCIGLCTCTNLLLFE